MELKDFIIAGLEHIKRTEDRVLSGLTQHEIIWRPGPHTNSIGLILFHMYKGHDGFIARFSKKPEIWESGKWYEKLGLPQTESGHGYTVETLSSFKTPKLKDLQAYGEAVNTQALNYVKGLKPAGFDEKIDGFHGEKIVIGQFLAFDLIHAAEHIGEIGYLRGLQRGLDK
jgi:hypothetical protein